MSAETHAAQQPTLRQRRRAAATQEILEAAEHHIAEHGPHAMSLRAIARGLGMTVQALYHYFPNRDALVTALIAKAYDDLAAAVQAAVDDAGGGAAGGAVGGGTAVPRLVVAAEGYRRWAIAHPERFQLLYGAPLRDYEAPVEGPTTQAVRRMSGIFQSAMFDGFTPEQLAAADTPALTPSFQAFVRHLPSDGLGDLSPQAAALFLSAWGHLTGLVVLEVFGHTGFMAEHQAEVFRFSMLNMLDDTHRRIRGAAGDAE
ncbi:TetR/AcrR family transcriptional regulator [Streptomyces flavofungini]|uniref:WHG domain-containing protein n=1 Tax=Streptomyces flavofungini TaxID=68200 RepID=A0ABS0XBH4_9ACTN|nr:TetR family transcriptional regulator [Streptomyces flavofungini]MBJ3810565.1 WHG domain-containing protein [Streptomyces flavofungini]GHC83915.1 TetR family transcriptional regulator [Streptomyces flavofungini]